MVGKATSRTGKSLGRYRLERELGRGGMGVVYLATDERTGREVALKTTAVAGLGGEASRSQRRQRFIREVQALTQVNHDNVVHVFDAGEADDADLGWVLYYVMDFIDGETLAQLVQRAGALAPGVAANICMQVAGGLSAAHAAGIVHRDVKPANIFISDDGRVKIGDFGICKIEGATQITRRDQLVGTPNYLAPEQILGGEVTPATDVFALGALFYIVVMNRPLREHVDAQALLRSAQSDEPVARIKEATTIPSGLRQVIARCLERDPKRRWPDGGHLHDALAEHATRLALPARASASQRALSASTTSDASNPFASLPTAPADDVLARDTAPGGDDDDASDDQRTLPAATPHRGIAAMAQKLLDEVDRRPAPTRAPRFADPAPSSDDDVHAPIDATDDDDALPVARSESTVMFHRQHLLDDGPSPHGAAGDDVFVDDALPVAQSESTRIFQMRTLHDDDDDDDDTDARQLDTPAAVTRVRVVDEPAVASGSAGLGNADSGAARAPANWLRRLTRGQRVATAAALAATGLVVALLVVSHGPTRDSAGVAAPAARSAAPLPAPELPLPSLCSGSPATADARAQSQARVDEAAALRREGAQQGLVREKLLQATALDPRNTVAFYRLAQLLTDAVDADRQTQAYQCVCALAPRSPECATVTRMGLDR